MSNLFKLNLCILALLPALSYADYQSYIGLGVGGNFFNSDNTITATGVSGKIERTSSINALMTNLYAGEGFTYQRCYLGGEVYANYNFGDSSTTNTLAGPPFVYSLKQTLNYGLGVDITPGYYAAPNILLFGIAGYGLTQFKTSVNEGGIEGLSGNHEFNFSGPQLGLGATLLMTSHYSIRLQDTYTFYNSKTKTTTSPGIDLPITVKMDPMSNQVMLGLTANIG